MRVKSNTPLSFDDAFDVGSFLEISKVNHLLQQKRAAVALAEVDRSHPERFVLFLPDNIIELLALRSGGLQKLMQDVQNTSQYASKIIDTLHEDKLNNVTSDPVLVRELARLLRQTNDVNCALLPPWLASHLIIEYGIMHILIGCPAASFELSEIFSLYNMCYERFEDRKDQVMLSVAQAIGLKLTRGSKKGKHQLLSQLSSLQFSHVTIAFLSGLTCEPYYLYEARKLWPNFMSQASELIKVACSGFYIDKFLGRFRYDIPGTAESEAVAHLTGFQRRADGAWRIQRADTSEFETSADEMSSTYDVEIEHDFDEFRDNKPVDSTRGSSSHRNNELVHSGDSLEVFVDSHEYLNKPLPDDSDNDNNYFKSEPPLLLQMWCKLARNYSEQHWWGAQLQAPTAVFVIQLLMKYSKTQEFAHELGVTLASKYGFSVAEMLPTSIFFGFAARIKKSQIHLPTNCWLNIREEILRRILMEKSRSEVWKTGLQLLLDSDYEHIQEMWLHALYDALPINDRATVTLFRQLCSKVQSNQPSQMLPQFQRHELHV